jgi:phenylalanyl-tRNA synthetase beta chain
MGKVFTLCEKSLPEEKWKVGGLLTGSPFISALDKGQVDYFYLKGVVENLFSGLGLKLPRQKEADHFLLQWGKSAEIEGVGVFGALHPDLQRSYEITKPVFFFEFDLEALFKLRASEKRYKPLPKYPFVFRDISMFIPQGLENQDIIDLIREVGGDLVEKVYPFDRYQDSIAYRIIYRHRERTLTEEEVNKKHQEIVQALTSKLMVKIR